MKNFKGFYIRPKFLIFNKKLLFAIVSTSVLQLGTITIGKLRELEPYRIKKVFKINSLAYPIYALVYLVSVGDYISKGPKTRLNSKKKQRLRCTEELRAVRHQLLYKQTRPAPKNIKLTYKAPIKSRT